MWTQAFFSFQKRLQRKWSVEHVEKLLKIGRAKINSFAYGVCQQNLVECKDSVYLPMALYEQDCIKPLVKLRIFLLSESVEEAYPSA